VSNFSLPLQKRNEKKEFLFPFISQFLSKRRKEKEK
jgi:hypothetical protein